LAERRLDALCAERVAATVTTGWAGAAVRPGALLSLEGESGSWRVRRWTLGDMRVKLELVRAPSAATLSSESSSGRVLREEDQLHGATSLRLVELPLTDGGDRPAVVALAAGEEAGWRSASLSVSYDGGASWRDIGGTAAPAVMGSAVTRLPAGQSALFDASGTVEVELLSDAMPLAALNDDALVAGANLALIGNELVQFGAAERIGPRRYRLSRLLRGRRGTEWAAGAHQAGEPFALIDRETALPVDVPEGLGIGGAVALLASGVGDGEPAEAELLLGGEALRPPSPVHLRAAAFPNGDVLLSWVRRSRLGWSWTSGSDTPLGEEREAYRVTLSGAGFSRSAEVGAPAYTYGAAERAADGAGPVEVRVVQVGTHAHSRAAVLTLS
jgi:hypothetical protein